MAQENRTTLKQYFETGKKPTEQEYENLIDSTVHKSDDKANLAEAADETIDDKYITPKTAKRAVETHLPTATTSEAGIVRRSTAAEVDSGANVNAYVTPLNARNTIEDLAPGLAPVQSVNGLDGHVVLDLGGNDSGWQNAVLLNGIENYSGSYGDAKYRKKDGIVFIQGLVRNGTPTGSQTEIFTLPIGYRPDKILILNTLVSGNTIVRIDIFPTGQVRCYNYNTAWTSISGLSFLAN